MTPLSTLAGVAVLVALGARAAGIWTSPRRNVSALPFAVLAPLVFVAQEHLELLLEHHYAMFGAEHAPAFAVGLALQAPFALAAFLLARGLMRLADSVRALIARREASGSPRSLAAPRGHSPAGSPPRASPRRFPLRVAHLLCLSPPPPRRAPRLRPYSPERKGKNERSFFTRRDGAIAVGVIVAAALTIVATHWITQAKPSAAAMDMSGMDMSSMPSMQGSAYWAKVGGGAFHSDGKTRTYYIAADEVVWDYAPAGHERDHRQAVRRGRRHVREVGPRPDRLDATSSACTAATPTRRFTHLKPRPADEQYLGFLGPVIRAEVGDTIKVVFRNTCPFPASIHPHGVFYDKDSEGAPYNDGTSGSRQGRRRRPDRAARHTYIWQVPERAGPGPGRRQLGDVDVPLAHRRDRRHLRRPDGPDGDHRAAAWPAPTAARRTSTARSSRSSRS